MSQVLYAVSDTLGMSAAYGAPDGSYGNQGANDWTSTFSMGSPSTALDGLQSVQFYLNKHATGGGDPTVTIEVLNDGVSVATLVSGLTVSAPISPTYQWDSALTPGTVTFRLTTSRSGGSPANRRGAAVDAIVWTAELYVFLGSTFSAYVGSQWVAGKLKRYDGAQWVAAQVRRWTGSQWEDVP